MPIAATAASAKADSTAPRLVATAQTSSSTWRDCQSHSAKATASWVLPDEPSQSRAPSAATRPGTSATAVPGTSAARSAGAVSGRALNPSASEGTAPDLTGQDACPLQFAAGPGADTSLSMATYPRPSSGVGSMGLLSVDHPGSHPGLPAAIIVCITFRNFSVTQTAPAVGDVRSRR